MFKRSRRKPKMAYERFDDDVENETRIVLLGAAGSGKSRTGNLLFGSNDYFEVGSYSMKTTVKSSDRYGTYLKVADTPGLFGVLRDVDIILELDAALQLTNPGPHMFILCIPMCRCTDQANKAVQKYVEYFGETIYDFLTLAFTFVDQWEYGIIEKNSSPDLDVYIQTLPNNMKQLIQKCQNRYCFINNRKTGDEKLKQGKEIIDNIHDIIVAKKTIFKSSTGFCMTCSGVFKQCRVACRSLWIFTWRCFLTFFFMETVDNNHTD